MIINETLRPTGPGRRRGRFRTVRLWSAVAAVAVVAVACGGDDDSDTTTAPAATTAAAPTTAAADAATTTAAGAAPTTAGAADTTAAAASDDLEPRPLAERAKVRVVWPVGVEAFGSVIAADELGEFDAENLDVEFIVAPPAEAVTLLETDRADVWVTSVNATLFNAREADIDLRIVAPTFYPNPDSLSGLWLSNDLFDAAGDVDVDKLKGAKIALGGGGPGASTTPLIDKWLQSIGLSLSDLDVDGSLNGADILVGMQGGGVDGGWLSDPVWITAQEDGIGKPVVTQAGDFGKYALSAYVAHGRFIDEHTDVAEAFFRALARANRDHLQGDYHADSEVVSALADVTGTPADSITASLPLVFDPTLAFDPEIIDILQATWLSVGGVLEYSEAIPATDVVDQSVIPGGGS